jgi:hypothetical protein
MGWNYRSAPSRCGIPEAAAFGGGNSLKMLGIRSNYHGPFRKVREKLKEKIYKNLEKCDAFPQNG